MTGVAPGSGGTGLRAGHRPGSSGVEFGVLAPEFVDGAFIDTGGTPTDELPLDDVDFQEGDVMYLMLAGPASAGLETPPPGWVNAKKPDTSGLYLYSRKMNGGETKVFLNETSTGRAQLAALRNVDPALPLGYYEDQNAASSITSLATVSDISTSTGAYNAAVLPEGYSMLQMGTNISATSVVTPFDDGGDPDYIPAAEYEDTFQFTDSGTGQRGFIQLVKNAERFTETSSLKMGADLGEPNAAGVSTMSIAVGAPRTARWLTTPQIIGRGSFQTTTATPLPKIPGAQPGDLQVFFLLPWVWDALGPDPETGFNDAEQLDIIDKEGVFLASASYTLAGVYDESHGDSYALSGINGPDVGYSRFCEYYRIVNHGNTFDSRYGGTNDTNSNLAFFPQPPITVEAATNDIVLVAASARSDIAPLTFVSNPDGFTYDQGGGQTVGGAGGGYAMGHLIVGPDQAGTVTLPQFDHTNEASTTFGDRVGWMVVRPPLPAGGAPVGAITESVVVELNDVEVASTTEPAVQIIPARVGDVGPIGEPSSASSGITDIAQDDTVIPTSATVTDAESDTVGAITDVSESEAVVANPATVTDDESLGLT